MSKRPINMERIELMKEKMLNATRGEDGNDIFAVTKSGNGGWDRATGSVKLKSTVVERQSLRMRRVCRL